MKKPSRDIDLLNCEGPKTKFTKVRVKNDENLLRSMFDEAFMGKEPKYEYDVTDEADTKIAHMTLDGVKSFIKGDITLVDSKGKEWHYPTSRRTMGLSLETVNAFFNEAVEQ